MVICLSKKIVVFAPHPDDETLGCGGTIARRLSEGYEVFVIVMTDGRNALSKIFGITDAPTPKEMREIRKREMLRAMKILGVSSEYIRFLDFEDGKLLYSSREASNTVYKIINELKPAEIYFPHEKDRNPDHQATNIIVRDCVENLSFSTHAYKYSLGQRFSRLGSIVAKLFHLVRNHLVYVDISEFVDLKAAAMEEYKSQTRIINKGQNRPVVNGYKKRFLKGHEVFYIQNQKPK